MQQCLKQTPLGTRIQEGGDDARAFDADGGDTVPDNVGARPSPQIFRRRARCAPPASLRSSS